MLIIDFDGGSFFLFQLTICYLTCLLWFLFFFIFSFLGVLVRLGPYHLLSCCPSFLLLINICHVFFWVVAFSMVLTVDGMERHYASRHSPCIFTSCQFIFSPEFLSIYHTTMLLHLPLCP